jgi:glycosyltransferase involved in cell wall biosynthesis
MISYLIPAYNAQNTIEQVISSIINQSYKTDYEIIVLNDGSTDKTKEKVLKMKRSFKKIKLINQNNMGLGYGRNRLLKEAKGNWIVFLDSDIILDKNWLREIINNKKKGIEGYTGICEIADKNNLFCKLDQKLQPQKEQTFSISNQFVGYMNYLIPKKVFNKVGKFNEIFRTNGEDVEWFTRAFKKGYKFLLVPTAKVTHAYKPPNLIQFLKRKVAYAEASAIPFIHKDYRKVIEYLIRTIMIITLILLSPFYPIQVLALLFIFLLLIFYRSLKTTRDFLFAFIYALGMIAVQFGIMKTVIFYLLFKRVKLKK